LFSKLQHEFFSCKGFLILVYNEAIIKCYNFLLLFPSGFKEFYYSTYTHVFFLVFILQEFLEEQYDSLISTSDSIKGECYGYFIRGDLISSDSLYGRSILTTTSPTTAHGISPKTTHVPVETGSTSVISPTTHRGHEFTWGESFLSPPTV
jgi:hypothetical protein